MEVCNDEEDKFNPMIHLKGLKDDEANLIRGTANEDHRRKLIHHRDEIIHTLEKCDVTKLLNSLQQQNVLTDNVRRILLEAETSRSNMLDSLLDIIPSRGSGAYMYFCDVLADLKLESLSNKLREGEDMNRWSKFKQDMETALMDGLNADDSSSSAAAEDDNDWSMSSDSDMEDEDENCDDTKLRGYQKELAGPGLEGKNYIVCAPTGCGKTWVAAYIIKEHLEKNPEGKVAFCARTIPLVKQQYKLFKRLLKPYKVDWLTSANSQEQLTLEELVHHSEVQVVCMTPGILDNVIQERHFDLSALSLMLFDECHHTHGRITYNRVMGKYVDQKLRLKNQILCLPQVIGFTATLGVGKAHDQTEANNYSMTICANMDADMIKIVSEPENKEELAQYVMTPDEIIRVLPSKKKKVPTATLR